MSTNGRAPSLSERLRLEPLDDDLRRVEELLMEVVSGRDAFLDEVTSYIAGAGGKRIRPALALCGAYAGQRGATLAPAPDRAIGGAVAVEVLHLATLYHDDILDEATLRRGVPSANARWNNTTAVIGGDILLARATTLAASLGQAEAALLAHALEEVCAGQAAELSSLYDPDRDEKAYEVAIAGKTAALMAASLQFGGLASALDPIDIERSHMVGLELGMAFQLVDDLLDLEGSTADIGKPAGADIVEGVYTLPVIIELRTNERLRELLRTPPSAAEAEEARRHVVAGTGPVTAARRARAHVERACALSDESEMHPEVARAIALLGDLVLEPVRVHHAEVLREHSSPGM
jgi:heptaprenyl diphosphate synthase